MSHIDSEIFEYIQNIDFSRQKSKMLYPLEASGTGWSKEEIDEVEQRYKNWLFLVYQNRDNVEEVGFDLKLDWFWHHHILDSLAYVEFCEKVFGFYLHHDPYAGMPGEKITMDDLAQRYDYYSELASETTKAA